MTSTSRHGDRAEGLTVLGIPAAGLAALPACPACYPLYAGILSSLGLTALIDPAAQTALTGLFLVVVVAALTLHASRWHAYGPLGVGLAGSVVVLAGKFVLGWNPITYAGVGLLMGASAWNVWSIKARRGGQCEGCAPENAPPTGSEVRP